MTTEEVFAIIVGVIVVTALATWVSAVVLWFFLSGKEARRSDDVTQWVRTEGAPSRSHVIEGATNEG